MATEGDWRFYNGLSQIVFGTSLRHTNMSTVKISTGKLGVCFKQLHDGPDATIQLSVTSQPRFLVNLWSPSAEVLCVSITFSERYAPAVF